MRSFSDTLELRPASPHGLAIRMGKNLTWQPDAPGLDPERWHPVSAG